MSPKLGTTLQITPRQKQLNTKQIAFIDTFLIEGEKIPKVEQHVLEKSGFPGNKELWNQLMIFLALTQLSPARMSFSPSLPIDEIWHQFILCTREYTKFCESVLVEYIHHVPDALTRKTTRPKWRMTRSLLTSIATFDPAYWPGGEKSFLAPKGSETGETGKQCSSDCKSCSATFSTRGLGRESGHTSVCYK